MRSTVLAGKPSTDHSTLYSTSPLPILSNLQVKVVVKLASSYSIVIIGSAGSAGRSKMIERKVN